jgi:anti-sigma factor RsiW
MTDGEHVSARLEAWLDGELGASEAAAVEAHVKACGSCGALATRLRGLRSAIGKELPPLAAPDVLRARVRDALRDAAPRAGQARLVPWRGIGLVAAAVVAIAGSWWAEAWWQGRHEIVTQVLAAHVRSLQPGHLTDVASTDQHTVKPWFDGRLDYAPPVSDEAAEGFPLLGGRLDYVNGRPVAALVYGRRLHRINLFVWPERNGSLGPAHAERDGYNVVHWTRGDMTFWAVSDLDRSDLAVFVRLLQRPDSAIGARPAGGPVSAAVP